MKIEIQHLEGKLKSQEPEEVPRSPCISDRDQMFKGIDFIEDTPNPRKVNLGDELQLIQGPESPDLDPLSQNTELVINLEKQVFELKKNEEELESAKKTLTEQEEAIKQLQKALEAAQLQIQELEAKLLFQSKEVKDYQVLTQNLKNSLTILKMEKENMKITRYSHQGANLLNKGTDQTEGALSGGIDEAKQGEGNGGQLGVLRKGLDGSKRDSGSTSRVDELQVLWSLLVDSQLSLRISEDNGARMASRYSSGLNFGFIENILKDKLLN